MKSVSGVSLVVLWVLGLRPDTDKDGRRTGASPAHGCAGGAGESTACPWRVAATVGHFVGLALLLALLAPPAWGQGDVVLEWYGHSFVRLTSPAGVRVAMDPFGEIGYPMPEVTAEVVTVSHEHGDHNNAALIRGAALVLRGLTEGGKDWQPIGFARDDVRIASVPVYHDAEQGRRRGKNTIVVVEAGGLRVAHLSDMGHIPTEAQFQALGRVDVLLVPVGGNFSIDGREARRVVERLGPRVAIPIHYKTAATARWPIEDERAFVAGHPRVNRIRSSRVVLNPASLPAQTEIWVLTPPGE